MGRPLPIGPRYLMPAGSCKADGSTGGLRNARMASGSREPSIRREGAQWRGDRSKEIGVYAAEMETQRAIWTLI